MRSPTNTPRTSERQGQGGDRQKARGESTRESILLTAERLFAERGIAAVPLRDIVAAAGQKNSVAVQYHFGDREGLVHAVAVNRAAFVDEVRSQLLAERSSTGASPTPIDHVRAFVVSLARNVSEDNHYVPFLSRYMVERGGYTGLATAVPGETVDTLRNLLREVLDDLDELTIELRWELVMTTAVHTLGRYQMMLHAGGLPAPFDELVDDLVRVLTAVLEAPTEAD